VILQHKYLKKNIVHFIGGVLLFGNEYDYCSSCLTLFIHVAIAENTKEKTHSPYSEYVFNSVHDYKTTAIFSD
jgi:hypothetical protein